MKTFFFALGFTVGLFSSRPVLADQLNLPGHNLSMKEATAKASNIFTGLLVSLDPVKSSSGQGEYVGKVVYVSRPANGFRVNRVTQNTTAPTPMIPSDLGIPVTMKVGAHESAPVVGKSYVFYGKDNMVSGVRGYQALKLSPTGDYGEPLRAF